MKNSKGVIRFNIQDKASSYNRTIYQFIFTFFRLLLNRQITLGKNSSLGHSIEYNLTDNASISFGHDCTIKPHSYFILTKPFPKIIGGNYVGIGRDCYFSIKSTLLIGSFTRIGPRVTIIDQDHEFSIEDLIMNQKSSISPITIGSDVWIGCGVTILKGVNIGNGAVIAAGAVVNKSIPSNEIWGGIPAKFLKVRN